MDNYNKNANDPTNDEYLFVEETVYDTGYDADPDTKDIKEAVGEAVSGIPGVLALKGGLTDIFKKDEDLTRGVSVRVNDDDRVEVSVKVIAETGYNEADLIRQMTDAITDDLQMELGMVADRVDVKVAQTMSRDEFLDKYDADRALH